MRLHGLSVRLPYTCIWPVPMGVWSARCSTRRSLTWVTRYALGSNEIGPTLGALAFARIPASNNLAIGFDLGFSVGPYFQSGDCVLGLFCEEQFEWDRVYMLNTAISLERRETSGFAYRSYVGVKTPVSSPGPPDRGFDGDGDPLSRPRQSASSALPYLGAAIGYAF